ncbi:MAG TPA: sugar phosphate isomerase/epimerase [Polyangiales bacterium]|nr:sugar phosphate isomerase/epimerase [Polyangiales bacterium]
MNISLCTISFRHQLISLGQIAQWAAHHRFQGIELWGVHAKNLIDRPEYDIDWLQSKNLRVPMISDYLPVQGERKVGLHEASKLCRLTQSWRAQKLRTFAGDRASGAVPPDERRAWVTRMRELCEVVAAHGLYLVVETHPNTLADTPASTLQLVEEIDHPALRLNFDVIHVWEAGAEPLQVFRELKPFIAHMHLKNVTARELLPVFAPANVYAPMGSRAGMVRLFDGAFDFQSFLRSVMAETQLSWDDMDASLEWFGPDVLSTLAHDGDLLMQFDSEHRSASRSLAASPNASARST